MTLRWTAALLLIAPLGLVRLSAQQYTRLSGLIRDTSESAVPGATVTVVHEETGFRRVTHSGPDGGYGVASLLPGVYKLTIRKEGFRTVVRFGVKLDVAQGGRVDVTLPVGSVQEVVTVESAPASLNTEDASVGTLIERDWMERLPLNGRGLLSLLELAPGTVVTPSTRGEPGQFTVNGQRPNTHYFTVDGVSVNTGVSGGGSPAQTAGGALPGMTAFGSFHALVPLEALEEFRVQTSSVTPEFGRLPGAQVALSSRAGTNGFHGSLFEFFRHERLAANNWFANRHGDPRAPLRLNDFGATLGGPVRHNRTFFFVSYERLRLREPATWTAAVPSADLRQAAPEWVRPALNLFPAPNGAVLSDDLAEWTGRSSRPARLDSGSVRIDHAITARVTLFGRYSEAPSATRFGGGQVNDLSIGTRSLTLGLNARAGAGFVQDFRANFARAAAQSIWLQPDGSSLPECALRPVTAYLFLSTELCDTFFRLSIAGVGQAAAGRESETRQSQWNVMEAITWNRGAHQMRFGADYRRLRPWRRGFTNQISVQAGSLSELLESRNVWVALSPADDATTGLQEISVFAQDSWRATPRLTLTYGLRWELNPPPVLDQRVSGVEPSTVFGERPSEVRPWPLRYVNFAPRAGLAYRLSAAGNTVLRAGLGIYYDSSLGIATDLVNGGPFNVWYFGNPASAQSFPARSILSYGFEPNLTLPAIRQWNVALEHSFGGRDVASLSYVGSVGSHLLRREIGGSGDTELVRLAMATNHGASHYHGLQAQYRRRWARSLQVLAAYTWSHSIDNGSADSALQWVGSGLGARSDRGPSDFDVRHNFTAGFTIETPRSAPRLGRDWALDGMLRARSGFPINVLNAEHAQGVGLTNAFRPDLVPGLPVWMDDANAPGGRRINRAAFAPRPGSIQGNLGRNALGGFGASQFDVAVRREFRAGGDRTIQLRFEAFNALNQASLADPARFLSSPLFGRSTSMLNLMLGSGSPASGLTPMLQTGGPRSLQVALRFRF